MRGLGLSAVLGMCLGLFGVITGAALVAGDQSDGFADLAGAIAIMFGVLFLVFCGALSAGVHAAYASWSAGTDNARRRMEFLGISVLVSGVVMAGLLLTNALVVDGQLPLAALALALATSGAFVFAGRPSAE